MSALCPTTPAMISSPFAAPMSESRAGAPPLTRCRSVTKLAEASFTAELAESSMSTAVGWPLRISGKLLFAGLTQTETGSVQAKAGAAAETERGWLRGGR